MRLLASRPTVGLAAICGVLLTPALLASTEATHEDVPTAKEVADAGALFRSSCAACHLPPDPDHVTDRAWLDQVTDTA